MYCVCRQYTVAWQKNLQYALSWIDEENAMTSSCLAHASSSPLVSSSALTFSTSTYLMSSHLLSSPSQQLAYEILRRLAEKDGSYEEAALMVRETETDIRCYMGESGNMIDFPPCSQLTSKDAELSPRLTTNCSIHWCIPYERTSSHTVFTRPHLLSHTAL